MSCPLAATAEPDAEFVVVDDRAERLEFRRPAVEAMQPAGTSESRRWQINAGDKFGERRLLFRRIRFNVNDAGDRPEHDADTRAGLLSNLLLTSASVHRLCCHSLPCGLPLQIVIGQLPAKVLKAKQRVGIPARFSRPRAGIRMIGEGHQGIL